MRGKLMSVKNDLKKGCVIQPDQLSDLTYADLKRSHQDKLKTTNKSRQQIRNQISSLNKLMKHLGRNDGDLIGDDFGPNFQNKLGDYIFYCKSEGLVQSTLTNSVSHLRKIAKTAKEIMLEDGLPESFNDALSVLVERSGLSKSAISEFTGLAGSTLYQWIEGKHVPIGKNKGLVPKLERLFGVTSGILQKRFPQNAYGSIKRGNTEYGKKLQKLHKDRYHYHHPTEEIKAEWQNLVNFFTVPFFLDDKERNSKWRVRSKKLSSSGRDKWFTQAQGGVCPAAGLRWAMVSSFLGFLILPKDRGGEGLAEKELSLALLSDANLVVKYIIFRKNRSGCFTRETEGFLDFCFMLLRKRTGYLRQFSQMGEHLLNTVGEDDWEEYCERNREKILKVARELKRGKQIKKGRNPQGAYKSNSG
jgi:hypothetical protein